MTTNDFKIARELKERLVTQVELVDFRVFGSRAREDADAESDMDVFVEVESLTLEVKEKIHETTWAVGFNNDMIISPLVVTRYEVEQTALRSSAIIRNITREGIVI